jgi:two-component system LytT family response regulator
MKLRAIIADDEPLGRERVRTLLKDEPDVEVVAEAANGREAVAAVRKHAPDLLFLDVQMPELDGFEVLRGLGRERLPVVIFVTAFDEHAVRAFEVHALDYLLKPFKPSRFKQAVARAREQARRRGGLEVPAELVALLKEQASKSTFALRLAVKSPERTVFVKVELLDWAESAGNYVVLHSGKETHVMRETMSALTARLDPAQFLRVSRSALVNADRIKELQVAFNGEHVVVMRDGTRVPMTRGLREVQAAMEAR